jgi:integrase
MARKPKRRRSKGLGTIWQRGPWWYVQWRESGKRHHAKLPDRETAEKVLAKILSDVALNRHGIETEKAPSPPLRELAKPWLEARKASHRSQDADAGRWKNHLAPRFGKLRPDEVDQAAIRAAVEFWRGKGLTSSTCMRCVCLLSSLYTDLVERGIAKTNPAKGLPRATRRLLKSQHDPKTTPFVEKLADVERIYRALAEPVNLAYAVGSMAGLRVGELLALRWANVDLEHRRLIVSEQVQDGKVVRPKDLEARVVPIVDSLLPVLQAAKLASGGHRLVVPPMREKGGNHLGPHTLSKCLREVLAKLNKDGANLPAVTWYQATRHTFASQWVMAGGSIEKLKEAMGHSTVLVTERYAHLRGDVFTPTDLGRMVVDFSAPTGKVLPMVRPGADPGISHRGATEPESAAENVVAAAGGISNDSV